MLELRTYISYALLLDVHMLYISDSQGVPGENFVGPGDFLVHYPKKNFLLI